MPGAIIIADQPSGAGAGSPGIARNDLWLGHAVDLSIGTTGNAFVVWTLLDVPPGSAATLSSTTADTTQFIPDKVGTYRVQLSTSGGGTSDSQIRVYRVRYDASGALAERGWALPATGEEAGEANYDGNTRAWSPVFEDILKDIRENAFDVGLDLSNDPAEPSGTAAAGTSGAAARGDHVHPLQPHGDQAGGSLHAVATPSTAGFMSAADKTAVDGLGTTYAPIVHTHSHGALSDLGADDHPQYVLRTDGAVTAIASTWAVRDGSGYLGVAGLTHTDNIMVQVASQFVIQTAGATRLVVDAGGFASYGNFVFGSSFASPNFAHAAKTGNGTDLTVQAQSSTNGGLGGHLKLNAGGGGTKGKIKVDGLALEVNGSTATEGLIRLKDGELINAKADGSNEVCALLWSDTYQTLGVGTDEEGTRTAPKVVVGAKDSVGLKCDDPAGEVFVQAENMYVGAHLEVGMSKASIHEVNDLGTLTDSMVTLDMSVVGSIIKFESSWSTGLHWFQLTNLIEGADVEIWITKAAGSGGTSMKPAAAFDRSFLDGSTNAIPWGTTEKIFIRGRVVGGKCMITQINNP